ANLFGYRRMAHGVAAYMGLINDGAVPGHLHRVITSPSECRVDDLALGYKRRAVTLIETEVGIGMADGVTEQRFRPCQFPHQLLGIRVDQQLIGVEPVPCVRLVGAVYPITVYLPGVGIR